MGRVGLVKVKWYNMHLEHERRNAHAQAERHQGEVFGCIPHGRGALT